MADPLIRRDAFADRVASLPAGGGAVVLTLRPSCAIATLSVRSGAVDLLVSRVQDRHAIDLPNGAASRINGGLAVVGTGPGTWLVVNDGGPSDWADTLAADVGAMASVADQSSAYALLRVSGPGARALLGRGAFIDFHPPAFVAGSAAVTLIAHIGVIVWQVDDTPTYDIAVFRSFAGSFWHWIETAAAGFGASLSRGG